MLVCDACMKCAMYNLACFSPRIGAAVLLIFAPASAQTSDLKLVSVHVYCPRCAICNHSPHMCTHAPVCVRLLACSKHSGPESHSTIDSHILEAIALRIQNKNKK